MTWGKWSAASWAPSNEDVLFSLVPSERWNPHDFAAKLYGIQANPLMGYRYRYVLMKIFSSGGFCPLTRQACGTSKTRRISILAETFDTAESGAPECATEESMIVTTKKKIARVARAA
jgi:hypothetical protein